MAAKEATDAALVRHRVSVDLADHIAGPERAVARVERAARDHGCDLHAGPGVALVVIDTEGGQPLGRRYRGTEIGAGVGRRELARHLAQQLGEVARVGQRGQEAPIAEARRRPVDSLEGGVVELPLREVPELLEGRSPRFGFVACGVGRDLDESRRAALEVDLHQPVRLGLLAAAARQEVEVLAVVAQAQRTVPLIGQAGEQDAAPLLTHVADRAGHDEPFPLGILGLLDRQDADAIGQQRSEDDLGGRLGQGERTIVHSLQFDQHGGPLRRWTLRRFSRRSGVARVGPLLTRGRVTGRRQIARDRDHQAALEGLPGGAGRERPLEIGGPATMKGGMQRVPCR